MSSGEPAYSPVQPSAGEWAGAPALVGHVGVTVVDVASACRWYEKVFGWIRLAGPIDVTTDDLRVAQQLQDVFGAERVEFTQVHMLAGSVTVELFQFACPERTSGRPGFDYTRPGYSHLCLVTAEIHQLLGRVVAEGGAQLSQIRPIFPDEPYLFVYCADPFGNVIELCTHSHVDVFTGRTSY